jgi:hypothetical protein
VSRASIDLGDKSNALMMRKSLAQANETIVAQLPKSTHNKKRLDNFHKFHKLFLMAQHFSSVAVFIQAIFFHHATLCRLLHCTDSISIENASNVKGRIAESFDAWKCSHKCSPFVVVSLLNEEFTNFILHC